MRRVLLVLMILLLPLRGLAGDFMGVQMASAALASSGTTAMPADCPMRAHATADAAHADAGQASAAMQGCESCDLCIPMTAWTEPKFEVVSPARHAPPLTGGVDFLSAFVAPTHKPPIS